MKRKQSIYEVQMAEVLPRGLAAPIKGARIAIFGFSVKTDRYTQIEEAIDRRYQCHSPANVTLMQRPEYKKIKKTLSNVC